MNGKEEKLLMSEVAIMYYENNHTQQEIADILDLSRQTVSKLLNDAVKEHIVEIKIHNPQREREMLQKEIESKFHIKKCIASSVSSKNEYLRKTMTVNAASEYITDIVKKGNLKIALSWGRTIQSLICTMPQIYTKGNIVFPLFGATDNENSYFSSNELARSMADKIGADVKYAWFPYLADSDEDCKLLKNITYYKKSEDLWNRADIAIIGIGNTEILEIFGKSFGYNDKYFDVIGDIATHFFNKDGEFIKLYDNSLCASVDNIKKSKECIAVACGDNKVDAMIGALKTGIIDTLITDEYTAGAIVRDI